MTSEVIKLFFKLTEKFLEYKYVGKNNVLRIISTVNVFCIFLNKERVTNNLKKTLCMTKLLKCV